MTVPCVSFYFALASQLPHSRKRPDILSIAVLAGSLSLLPRKESHFVVRSDVQLIVYCSASIIGPEPELWLVLVSKRTVNFTFLTWDVIGKGPPDHHGHQLSTRRGGFF